MSGPLAGLKILDFTQALAGPFCTQNLSDLGAEVVKVEALDGGDLSRATGPFHEADPQHRYSGYFQSINRGKKSISIDLKSPDGVELIKRLIPQFDVVVENFRVGVMDRLGLSYETLSALNHQLVYMTGPFGAALATHALARAIMSNGLRRRRAGCSGRWAA